MLQTLVEELQLAHLATTKTAVGTPAPVEPAEAAAAEEAAAEAEAALATAEGSHLRRSGCVSTSTTNTYSNSRQHRLRQEEEVEVVLAVNHSRHREAPEDLLAKAALVTATIIMDTQAIIPHSRWRTVVPAEGLARNPRHSRVATTSRDTTEVGEAAATYQPRAQAPPPLPALPEEQAVGRHPRGTIRPPSTRASRGACCSCIPPSLRRANRPERRKRRRRNG